MAIPTAALDEKYRVYAEALRDLAALDTDYGQKQNNVGFSRFDGPVGHALAETPFDLWTPSQLIQAHRILTRYKLTQLPVLGYDWAAMPKVEIQPAVVQQANPRQPGYASVEVEGDAFVLRWGGIDPLFKQRVDDARQLPGSRYDKDAKAWRVPMTMASIDAVARMMAAYAGTALPFAEGDSFRQGVDTFVAEIERRLAASAAASADPAALKLEWASQPEKVRPFQLAGITFAVDNKKTIIADDMGLGKGLVHGSKVLTNTGYRPIETIEREDLVIGSDGLPHRVTGVYPRGILPVYRVVFNDGTSLTVDEDHLWNVQHVQNGRRNPDQWQTLTVRDLIEIGIRDGAGNATWRIPMVEPVQFDPVDLPVDPYLLGVLLGDGGLAHNSIILTTADTWLVSEVQRLVPGGIMVEYIDRYDYRLKKLSTDHRNPLWDALRELNLKGANSHTKFIPDAYLYASPDERLAILQGLMDTDGSARQDGINEFCSVSSQLADGVAYLVQSLGGVARRSIKRLPGGGIAHRVNVKMTECPFRMPRKVDNWTPPTKYRPGRIIKAIEPAGTGEVTCIAVDAPDSLFVAEHCIVTHNTIQSILSVAELEAFPCLVICPASLKLNWKREIGMWLNRNLVVEVAEGTKPTTFPAFFDFLIINYDIMHAWKDMLANVEWKAIIADECHYLKTEKSQRTKAVKAVLAATKPAVRLMLTGTPILNKPIELWPILGMLDGQDRFGTWFKYAMRYCDLSHNGFGYNANGASNLDELNTELRSSGLMIRRRKEDVLTELPDKQWATMPVPISPASLAKAYDNAERDLERFLQDMAGNDDEQMVRAAALQRIATLRQIAWRGKQKAAIEWIDDFLETGKKLVVFGWHREAVEAIADHYDAPKIMGGMNKQEVEDGKERFQTDPDCRVIVCNIAAGGVGHTLTAASDVLFLEFAWNYALMDQAISRCHRIGQKDTVTGWMMAATLPDGRETIDHEMIELIAGKEAIVKRAIDGDVEQATAAMRDRLRAILQQAEADNAIGED